MSWQGARGKIDQAATQSSRPSFPFPLRSPLLKSSKKSLRGGNKWWPTFSFFLSALTDWRLSTVVRPRRFDLRSRLRSPLASVCRSESRLDGHSTVHLFPISFFTLAATQYSPQMTSPPQKLVSSLRLSVAFHSRSCLAGSERTTRFLPSRPSLPAPGLSRPKSE